MRVLAVISAANRTCVTYRMLVCPHCKRQNELALYFHGDADAVTQDCNEPITYTDIEVAR